MKLPGRIALALLALSAPFPSLILAPSAAFARAYAGCGANSYVNSRGHCVHRPIRANSAPAGATAQCRDGTYSFSESHRGTCSWHGGVSRWLR